MEHRDAVKGFRPGAEVSAVLPRMSLVDAFNDIEMKKSENSGSPPDATGDPLKLQLSKTDYLHVHRAVSLLLRQGGLSSEPCMVPQNVYDNTRATDLLTTTLDNNTLNVGEYLVMKHACKEGQFGLCTHDLPDAQTLAGPTTLTKKALKKSAMIKRVNTTDLRSMKSTLREVSEIKRLRKIKKIQAEADCLSFTMNTCQALLKPDCSKPTISKSNTIKTAIHNVLADAIKSTQTLSSFIYNSVAEMPHEEKYRSMLLYLSLRALNLDWNTVWRRELNM